MSRNTLEQGHSSALRGAQEMDCVRREESADSKMFFSSRHNKQCERRSAVCSQVRARTRNCTSIAEDAREVRDKEGE